MAYPTSKPPRIDIQAQGTISSSGKVTTLRANTAITFSSMVNSLEVSAHVGDITVKLQIGGAATETNTHLIEEGSSKVFDKMYLTGFTIVENGVTYSYSGTYY